MSDKGIIFSAPMVRALLDGRKTQTRRLLKPAPEWHDRSDNLSAGWSWRGFHAWPDDEEFGSAVSKSGRLPYAPGDRLYVRENFQLLSFGDYLPTKAQPADVRFAATDPLADSDKDVRGYPWRPCIHMPRWASRLTLLVTDVRVQRMAEISEADAIAEGIEPVDYEGDRGWKSYETYPDGTPHPNSSVPNRFARRSFEELWNSLHDKPGERWEDNPWIVAVSFDVKRGNIDRIGP